jgi:hypothetical protein
MTSLTATLLLVLPTMLSCLTLTGVADATASDPPPPSFAEVHSPEPYELWLFASVPSGSLQTYSTTIPTGHLNVTLNVTDGVTTTATPLGLGGVEGAAYGEMVGILNPVLELSELAFEVLEGWTVTDLLGSAEIPVILTVDPGTIWEYQNLSPFYFIVDPETEQPISTRGTTTFALSGEVELLGELIPFSFTRADVIEAGGVITGIVDSANHLPYAEVNSPEPYEFWLYASVPSQSLRTRGDLCANDFAEVQGLWLTLCTHLSFGSSEIHYVPEPATWLMLVAGTVFLGLLYRRRARGLRLG